MTQTKKILIYLTVLVFAVAAKADEKKFTAAEQQQISIATPGLFDRSDAFELDFSEQKPSDYAFPLPVGKASLTRITRV